MCPAVRVGYEGGFWVHEVCGSLFYLEKDCFVFSKGSGYLIVS